MIDPCTFSMAQKMSWVKLLLDDNYESLWKSIEMSTLNNFSDKRDIWWKTYASDSILKKLTSRQSVRHTSHFPLLAKIAETATFKR